MATRRKSRVRPITRKRKRRNPVPVRGLRYEVWVDRGGKFVPVHASDDKSYANDRAHTLNQRGQYAYVQDASTGRIVGPYIHSMMQYRAQGHARKTMPAIVLRNPRRSSRRRANPEYDIDQIRKRVAEKLGWTIGEVNTLSLPALREMVRPVSPKLAYEITLAMSSPVYFRHPARRSNPLAKRRQRRRPRRRPDRRARRPTAKRAKRTARARPRGLTSLAPVAAFLRKKHPGFTFRTYGNAVGFLQRGEDPEMTEWTAISGGETLSQAVRDVEAAMAESARPRRVPAMAVRRSGQFEPVWPAWPPTA